MSILVVFTPQVKLYRSLAYVIKEKCELLPHVCLIKPTITLKDEISGNSLKVLLDKNPH
jgi:hypothetical protein